MQIDVLTLAVSTAVTGAVGWLVKILLDTLRGYVDASMKWRDKMDGKIDALTAATQTTMRTELTHLFEKYTTRGWITPEEHAAWHDMHSKYSALDANGIIDSYAERIDRLPLKEI